MNSLQEIKNEKVCANGIVFCLVFGTSTPITLNTTVVQLHRLFLRFIVTDWFHTNLRYYTSSSISMRSAWFQYGKYQTNNIVGSNLILGL